MTQKEAQIRNNKIMQFRGSATRIKGLIPEDIWNEIGLFDRIIIIEAHRCYREIIEIMNSKAKCKHMYLEDDKLTIPKCHICGHEKYSRDGLGKAKG